MSRKRSEPLFQGLLSGGAVDTTKSLENLMTELRELNANNPQFLQLIDKLNASVILVNSAFSSPSKLILKKGKETDGLTQKPICNWGKKEIAQWSRAIKEQQITDAFIPEILAVIKQALLCSEGFLPRDIQILSVLSLMYKDKSQGRLAQIYTGEGKTTTIAILAVLNVMQGKKVDIVTSSEVLAQRDALEKKPFYELFGITVADNSSVYRAQKKCYTADVVYGDTGNYEADILCDEYKQYGTRRGRLFEIVIVDEVDNMFIDYRSQSTRLSTDIPGMSALTPVLEVVWNFVCSMVDRLMNDEGSKFSKIDPIVLVKLHFKEEMKLVKSFIESNVPLYLKEYALNQIMDWCFNASYARLVYKENQNYVIRDNKIVPVDYKSNGVLQPRMQWAQGLHQFLQMKHDLPVTPLNLTTNFLSNVTFFRRYGTNILGLTGTLGSENEQQLLKGIYTLDSVKVPSYKPRRLEEREGLILDSHASWLEAVKKKILKETDEGRAVLVVCETILRVTEIKEALAFYNPDLISMYVENTEEEQKLINERVRPGQIIIATNLAGRGTDLKISPELERNGGLHVILAFLPENSRVEEQAFGRAGRQGSPGTGQLIIDREDENIRFRYSQCRTVPALKKMRAVKESKALDTAGRETRKVINKDSLFTDFCDLMKVIRKESRNDKEVLEALEERWGLFLLGLADEHLLTDRHRELFNEFKAEILRDQKANEIIKNPKYYLKRGHDEFKAGRYEYALELFKKASKMNPFDCYPPYFQALSIIKLQEKSGDTAQLAIVEELLESSLQFGAEDLAKYEGIKNHYNKSQQHEEKLSGREARQDLSQSTFSPLQHVARAERSEADQQSNQGLKPIDETDSMRSCKRYDETIQVRHSVLQTIQKLKEGVSAASKAKTVFRISVKPIDSIYNAEQSKLAVEEISSELPVLAIEEDKKIPILPVVLTAILGALELLGGILLCATGIGAIWGYGLIIEGAGDLLTAAVTAATKQFDWKLYLVTKSLSVGLMLAGCGALNVAAAAATAAAPALIIGGRAVLGLAGTTSAFRSIASFFNKKRVAEETTQVMSDGELQKRLKEIEDFSKYFSPDNPTYNKEFSSFKALCIEALKVRIRAIPKNILDYASLLLDFDVVVRGIYKKVNHNHLEAMLDAAVKDFLVTEEVGLEGVGQNAFNLLEQHKVIDGIMGKLEEALRSPDLDFYAPYKLVHLIAHDLLVSQKQTLLVDSERTKKEKNELELIKKDLAEKIKSEKNPEKVRDLKAQLNDVRDEIDKKLEEIQAIEDRTVEFNKQVNAIEGVSSDEIIPAVDFLNGKVFQADTVFEVLDIDFQSAQEIFYKIPLHSSLEILRSLYVAAFVHLYNASTKRSVYVENCTSSLIQLSQEGDGSLIFSFWIKYLSLVAKANGHELERATTELVNSKIAKMKQDQEDELSSLEANIIGNKTSVPSDGDCYFSSVAVALGLTQGEQMTLRKMTIDQIVRNRDQYDELIVHSSFDEYVEEYSKKGAWMKTSDGNDIMVHALAERLGVHVIIHDEAHAGITQNINNEEGLPIIHLSYTGAHYSPYIPADDDLSHLQEIRNRVMAYKRDQSRMPHSTSILRSVPYRNAARTEEGPQQSRQSSGGGSKK
jgi:tetratricopeptide (TPR) repeat protein